MTDVTQYQADTILLVRVHTTHNGHAVYLVGYQIGYIFSVKASNPTTATTRIAQTQNGYLLGAFQPIARRQTPG